MLRCLGPRNASVGGKPNATGRSRTMMMRRRRPLMRAAMVGGTAYYAGKKVQQGREQDAETEARLQDLEAQQYQQQQQAYQAPPPPPPAPSTGISPEAMEQLKQLA